MSLKRRVGDDCEVSSLKKGKDNSPTDLVKENPNPASDYSSTESKQEVEQDENPATIQPVEKQSFVSKLEPELIQRIKENRKKFQNCNHKSKEFSHTNTK